MTSLRQRVAVLTFVVVVGGAALYLSYPRSALSPVPLGLTFTGFTTGAAQGQFAVFAISNANEQPINFCAALPHTREGGIWSLDICYPPPAVGTDLGAHQRAQFSVVLPTNGDAWRVPVVWSFAPTMGDRIRAVCRDNWLAVMDGRSPPGLHVGIGMTGQTAYTAVIRR